MTPEVEPAERHPRYWALDGEPTLLLGGSVEDNLFQIDDVETHLDDLVAVGGNYVRCTMSARDEGDLQPFSRAGEQYTLEEWNDPYWERLDRFLGATAERAVVVQLELWDCWDLVGDAWAESPWNPANTTAYSAAESGLPTAGPEPDDRFENPFFRTPPALEDNTVVREYQTAFVERVLEVAGEYDHVLYSIDNETDTHPAWPTYWAAVVSTHRPDAPLTEMWNPWELSHPEHRQTIDSPETYDFVEVSQNNFQDGEDHWSALQSCRATVTDPVRPLNNVKVYGSDDAPHEIFEGTEEGIDRFWRNVFGGCAGVRFHRPPFGIGLSEAAKTHLEGAREVTDELDPFSCAPRNDLLVGRRHNVASDAHPSIRHRAYVLADPPTEYAVYLPEGGWADLEPDLSAKRCRWFDVDAGSWATTATEPEVLGRLEAPGDGRWVALLD